MVEPLSSSVDFGSPKLSGRTVTPSAVMSVPISWLPSMRSKRTRSTFRIFPRSGRIACVLRSRPCLADPPAESPSTMYSSHFDGSRSWQSASLPGSELASSTPLRCTSSRAFCAAARACADSTHFSTTRLAATGFSSSQRESRSCRMPDTMPDTSDDTSLCLVCELYEGLGWRTEITPVRPSRTSSPISARSFKGLRRPFSMP